MSIRTQHKPNTSVGGRDKSNKIHTDHTTTKSTNSVVNIIILLLLLWLVVMTVKVVAHHPMMVMWVGLYHLQKHHMGGLRNIYQKTTMMDIYGWCGSATHRSQAITYVKMS